jgi:hypothetical protein
MKYTIKEILPAQILVEFEDESRALVPISPEATPEEIDHAVAHYDPDFLPNSEELINLNISIDEKRESKKLESINSTEEFTQLTFNELEHILNSLNPINLFLSNYYAEQGDTRIKDALNLKIVEYIDQTNLTVEQIIENINFSLEDIVIQAENELNAEQS